MDVADDLIRCATTADLYRVQIAAENRLTPTEIAALHAAAPTLPEPARKWVGKLAMMCRRVGKPLQPFRHRALGDDVWLFEGAGPADAPRSLVVAFCGVGLRMMLPTAPFLQGLPAARCDVLLLRDSGRLGFLDGVPGYAADLPALAARLAAEVPLARYGDRVCVGVSSGGAPALAFGPLIGARIALSLGGAHPRSHLLRSAPAGIDRFAFDRLRGRAPPQRTRLVCAHGRDHLRDAVRNRLLAMTVPGSELLVVRDVALHGVLAGLLQHDCLARFLQEILLDGALPADGVWQP